MIFHDASLQKVDDLSNWIVHFLGSLELLDKLSSNMCADDSKLELSGTLANR